MNPVAVDFPPPDMDCNVIANTGIPFGAAFGDDLFNTIGTIPPGWYAEPVTQPQYGSVSFPDNNGWQYVGGSTLPSVNTPDPFTYRLTNGTEHSNTATITPMILVEM